MPGFAAVPIRGHAARRYRAQQSPSPARRVADGGCAGCATACMQPRLAAFLQADGAFWRRMLSGSRHPGRQAVGISRARRGCAPCQRADRIEGVRCRRLRAFAAHAARAADRRGAEPGGCLQDGVRADGAHAGELARSGDERRARILGRSPPEGDTALRPVLSAQRVDQPQRRASTPGSLRSAAQPTPRFIAAREAFVSDSGDLASVGPSWIYNPLGKTLIVPAPADTCRLTSRTRTASPPM